MHKALVLTPEQEKAFKSLKRAFSSCHKAGLEIHGELNTLYAINGPALGSDVVTSNQVAVDDGNCISDLAECFVPPAFKGCWADDVLSICSEPE